MNSYAGKKAAVVGMARSGRAAARLLKKLGAGVRVTEKGLAPELEAAAAGLRAEGIETELGGHHREFLGDRDLLVISPGVRPDAEPCRWAKEAGQEVISEIELAASVCPATVVAITGTNGKTTTTTLVGEILRQAGHQVAVLGNIGTPFSARALELRAGDFVSLEVSSFQLETIKTFKPKVAVILNLTPDHLDRYDSVAEYLEAKKRIFMNQDKTDWLVLNHGDEALRELGAEAASQVIFFNKEASEGVFNQNQLAVLAVARALGVDREVCLEVFCRFRGVEHRMELVRTLRGVDFINDSKATNIDSTVWALNNISKSAVLIAGGRDKGSDFASLRELVARKVRVAVLVGEASDRIARAWKGTVPVRQVGTFEAAVAAASREAREGEIVLLSPMCKSFDLFTDYEHRGRTFKDLVSRLA